MRIRLVISVVLLAHAGPAAMACPPADSCLVNMRTTVTLPEDAPTTPTPAATVTLPALRLPVPTPPRLAPGEVQMPWIWATLREQVYSRMPTYEDPHEIKIVLAPVVVTSPSDTVPGIGIAGDF